MPGTLQMSPQQIQLFINYHHHYMSGDVLSLYIWLIYCKKMVRIINLRHVIMPRHIKGHRDIAR